MKNDVKRGLAALLAGSLLAALLGACAPAPAPTPTPDAAATPGTADPTAAPTPLATAEPWTPEEDGPALLPGAKWIWAETDENNVWVDFRKTFQIGTVPEEAMAEIAAENKYHLWVNGEQVVYDGGLKRGPNLTDGYFDTVDLAPYLREGENVLAVKAWFWGTEGEGDTSYSNIPIGPGGLIFAAQIGGERILSDGSWSAMQDCAYQDDTQAEYAVRQPNYRLPERNIYYDAGKAEDVGWTGLDYDAADWPAAQVRGGYGDAPWNELHLRPIPLFREYGLRDYLNSADYAGHTTSAGETVTMEVPYNAQLTPYLKISTRDRAVITITTENTDKTESVRTTYVAAPGGEQEWESPAWISGQHITYTFPAGVTIHRLAYRESGYASELAGTFSMDDAFYDALWQMAARTQYLCLRDSFMDCPDRERAQWTGDGASQMRQMMYCLDPDAYALYRKMVFQKLAWIPGEESGREKANLLPTVVPIQNEFYELPAQEMAAIVSLWDYYTYTGDSTVLRAAYQPALRYLQKWRTGNDGLVKHKTGRGLVDWQDTGEAVDTKVCENAWYYWSLSTLKRIAAVIGEADTVWIDDTMSALYDGYQTLWQEGVGYLGGKELDDRGNALAVLSGLAPEERWDTILTVLKTRQRASSYMEVYVLMAMCEMGHVPEALERITQRYGEMVSKNLERGDTTLWEYFTDGLGTYNHAWSGGPLYILSRYVAGIRPTAPGYASCEIVPDFSVSDHISAAVSTVKGMIALEGTADDTVKSCKLRVELPDGVTAAVAVPKQGGQTVITVNGETVYPDGGAAAAGGVRFLSDDGGYYTLEITGGGTYLFTAEAG